MAQVSLGSTDIITLLGSICSGDISSWPVSFSGVADLGRCLNASDGLASQPLWLAGGQAGQVLGPASGHTVCCQLPWPADRGWDAAGRADQLPWPADWGWDAAAATATWRAGWPAAVASWQGLRCCWAVWPAAVASWWVLRCCWAGLLGAGWAENLSVCQWPHRSGPSWQTLYSSPLREKENKHMVSHYYRRGIKTEERGKVVAAVFFCGGQNRFISLALFLFYARTIWRKRLIAPGR